jgi:hypothetical protein
MAMGGRSRGEAERAISGCHSFSNSTGSLRGTRGSTRDLGWLEQHKDKILLKELLGRASYVVWSYDTPIGFVVEDEVGNITRYYVDEQHTMTTSHHQGILRVAWGEYETIGERRPARRPRRPARLADQEAVDRANAVVQGYAEAAQREPTAAHAYNAASAARGEQEPYLAHATLLDPRFSDPNWVPDRDVEADRQAELRDIRRVRAEGTWTP